MRPAL